MTQGSRSPQSVRLDGVTKIYKNTKTHKSVTAVDNIDLVIEKGQFVTILGPSGSGKTTTLRMISGFETVDNGSIYLGSTMVNNVPPNKRDTAMVFQSYALLPHYNVFDNVSYGLKIRKFSKKEIMQKVSDILDLVELKGMENRRINEISGGEQQRVALARALVLEPSVLLFDEPLSNLDAKLRLAMRLQIKKIQKQLGITTIYVTHDQTEAMSLSDKIVLMNNGKIMQEGTPQELYYKPKNTFVADFIGEANLFGSKIVSIDKDYATVDINGVYLKLLSNAAHHEGDECSVMLRPEAMGLSSEGRIACKVCLSVFMGSYQYYQVLINDMLVKIADYNPKNHHIFAQGETAWLAFDEKDMYII